MNNKQFSLQTQEEDLGKSFIDERINVVKIKTPSWRDTLPAIVGARIDWIISNKDMLSIFRWHASGANYSELSLGEKLQSMHDVAESFPEIIDALLSIEGVEIYMVGSQVPMYLDKRRRERVNRISDLDFFVKSRLNLDDLISALYDGNWTEHWGRLNLISARNIIDHYDNPPIFIPFGTKTIVSGPRKYDTPAYVLVVFYDTNKKVISMKVSVYSVTVNYERYARQEPIAEFKFHDNDALLPLYYDLIDYRRIGVMQLLENGKSYYLCLKEPIRDVKLSNLGINSVKQALLWLRGVIDLPGVESDEYRDRVSILETRADNVGILGMSRFKWHETYIYNFAKAILKHPEYIVTTEKLKYTMPLLYLFLGGFPGLNEEERRQLTEHFVTIVNLRLQENRKERKYRFEFRNILSDFLRSVRIFRSVGDNVNISIIDRYDYYSLANAILDYDLNMHAILFIEDESEEEIAGFLRKVIITMGRVKFD